MFDQAQNFVINSGHFTSLHIETNHDAVSTILLPHVATGAIFDSAERYPPGRCHPGTRQRMIDRITNWMEDVSSVQRILWLYGSAGAGKSALMQAICELPKDSGPGMNGGSFFFARGHTDRGKSAKLFVTLSYQLAIQYPAVRKEINDALIRDPSLPTKSLDIQLQSLIILPLLRCQSFLPSTPILFIDGLDECDNDQGSDAQCQIISLIAKSLLDDRVPIRFMIASRPEYWIRDSFEASPLSDITLPISLRDDIDADKDIRAYLMDGFEKICSEKRRIMQSVELPWPPTRIVDRFVHDASGQYIYASTVLRFVGNDSPFSDPQEQLRIITSPGPHRAPAFTELDRLYSTILSVYPRRDTMKRVLSGLLVNFSLTTIHIVLKVPKTEITLVLGALSSLIDVISKPPSSAHDQPPVPTVGSFCHLSFPEFLCDKTRSALYHIDAGTMYTEVICTCVGMVQRNLLQNYKNEAHTSNNLSPSEYDTALREIWHRACDPPYEFYHLIPVFHGMVETLQRSDPPIRMNQPLSFNEDMRRLKTILLEVYISGSSNGADPTFLQLTKRLEILADVVPYIHARHPFLYRIFMLAEGVVWAVWVRWGMAYMGVRGYVVDVRVRCSLWYQRRGALMWAAWGYALSRCILCGLGLSMLWALTFGSNAESLWYRAYRSILWVLTLGGSAEPLWYRVYRCMLWACGLWVVRWLTLESIALPLWYSVYTWVLWAYRSYMLWESILVSSVVHCHM